MHFAHGTHPTVIVLRLSPVTSSKSGRTSARGCAADGGSAEQHWQNATHKCVVQQAAKQLVNNDNQAMTRASTTMSTTNSISNMNVRLDDVDTVEIAERTVSKLLWCQRAPVNQTTESTECVVQIAVVVPITNAQQRPGNCTTRKSNVTGVVVVVTVLSDLTSVDR